MPDKADFVASYCNWIAEMVSGNYVNVRKGRTLSHNSNRNW